MIRIRNGWLKGELVVDVMLDGSGLLSFFQAAPQHNFMCVASTTIQDSGTTYSTLSLVCLSA